MATAVNPYGDGRAAERTCQALARFLGLDAAVEEFIPEGPPAALDAGKAA
jgi:UDP-N-acetylglucosamine 2-epimerase (non-hydrolysing)